MKNLKKFLAVIVALALVTMSFAGCSKKSDDTTGSSTQPTTVPTQSAAQPTVAPTAVPVQDITLKVWAPQEEQDITTQMCDSFQEAHPEYKITWDIGIMGVDKVIDELKKDATVAADVFLYPSGGIPELSQAGIIYPITVDTDKVIAANSATSIKSCTLDNNLYGIPETPNSWFMYYNKSMYTADDVKSLETMMSKDLGPDVKNFSCSISNSWYMSAFFYAAGCQLFGADGTDPTQCDWNNATGLQVGQYLIDLMNNPKYQEDDGSIAGTLMGEGKLAALCSGTWSADSIKTALGDNYAAIKLPTINIGGKDVQLSNFADFKAFGVNSNTKYPKAAQQLAEWLGNEDNQLIRFENPSTLSAPTITDLLSNPEVMANQAVAALADQTQYSTPNPSTAKLNDYWGPAGAFGAGIRDKTITKDNLQESLDAMVNGFLATVTQ